MQVLNQQYTSIMMMPVDRFYECLRWKAKFDEEVRKIQDEQIAALNKKVKIR